MKRPWALIVVSMMALAPAACSMGPGADGTASTEPTVSLGIDRLGPTGGSTPRPVALSAASPELKAGP